MDENFLSPYDILGVSENASLGEIHCAYKRLVRTVHPDRNQKVYNWSKEEGITGEPIGDATITNLTFSEEKEAVLFFPVTS